MDKTAVERQYQNFLKKHPDGQISRKSFHAMMKECYPGTDTEKLERHIFRMYDTNKDNLKQIFKVFDINNDGFISLKELQRIVKDLFHLINEENADEASQALLAQSAFNEMDENHDGQVSEEEFIEACMSQKKFSTMLTLKIIDVFVSSE